MRLLIFLTFLVLSDQADLLRAANNPFYIIPGISAARIRLGDSETAIRRIWGEPQYRNFERDEMLSYQRTDATFRFFLRADQVHRIEIDPAEGVIWLTAQGVSNENFAGYSDSAIMAELGKAYPDRLAVYRSKGPEFRSHGISFGIRKGRVNTIAVFPARRARPGED